MFIRSSAHRSMAWHGKVSGKDVFRAPDGSMWHVAAKPSLDEAQRAAYVMWKKGNKSG